MFGDARVLALDHFLVEALHVICTEGWDQRTHLVQDATQRPNITLGIVRHVAPYLRARVIRRACLRVTEPFLDYFRNVEVSQLSLHISVEKDIGALHVSMQDFPVVQSLETSHNLYEDVPYLLLLDVGLPFLITAYLLEHIAVVSVLHDETTRSDNHGQNK